MVLLTRLQNWSRSASDLGDHLAGFTHRRRDMPSRISHPQLSAMRVGGRSGVDRLPGPRVNAWESRKMTTVVRRDRNGIARTCRKDRLRREDRVSVQCRGVSRRQARAFELPPRATLPRRAQLGSPGQIQSRHELRQAGVALPLFLCGLTRVAARSPRSQVRLLGYLPRGEPWPTADTLERPAAPENA